MTSVKGAGAGLAVDVARIGLFGTPEEAVSAVIGLTPSGRLGEVSDMSDAVVFLASDAARFVNGLPVDGGWGCDRDRLHDRLPGLRSSDHPALRSRADVRLVDYLDKGADLGPDRPCLTTDGTSQSYAEVRTLAARIAAGLAARGVRPGDRVAILSGNHPTPASSASRCSRSAARSSSCARPTSVPSSTTSNGTGSRTPSCHPP